MEFLVSLLFKIRIFYRNILQKYFTEIFYRNILQKYFTEIFYRNILQKYFTEIFYRNILQKYFTEISFISGAKSVARQDHFLRTSCLRFRPAPSVWQKRCALRCRSYDYCR